MRFGHALGDAQRTVIGDALFPVDFGPATPRLVAGHFEVAEIGVEVDIQSRIVSGIGFGVVLPGMSEFKRDARLGIGEMDPAVGVGAVIDAFPAK